MNLPRYLPPEIHDAGISYRQLDYWCKRGWLRPHGQGEGSGNPRWWPAEEIAAALRMAELIRDGFTPMAAASKAREQVAS